MSKLTNSLGKMIGPLPLAAWIVVVVLGVGIVVWNRKSATAPVYGESLIPRDTSTDQGVGMGGSGMWTNLTPPTAPSEAEGEKTSGKPTSNLEWSQQALNHAIALGFDPSTADYAIRQYMSNGSLDGQGQSIINVLLRALGALPDPLGPTDYKPTTPKPTTPKPKPGVPGTIPKPKPPVAGSGSGVKVTTNYVSHMVRYGETLAAIATAYGVRYATLFDANKIGVRRADNSNGVLASGYVPPGTRLVIPGVGGTPKKMSIKYTVKPGDTISSVAKKTGVTWAQVYDNNKKLIPNTANLKPGITLVIP